ncbi:hypothetical protein E4U21_007922 [Claviceps maximensis]|nr:hypothetical protein E4U21_007922 [Claviceps maximensis]
MSTSAEIRTAEDESFCSPPSSDETTSSDGSKYKANGARGSDMIHVDDVTIDTDFTHESEAEGEAESESKRQERAAKHRKEAETTAATPDDVDMTTFAAAMEEWDDGMRVCRQLLVSIPRVQRCLRPEDLNPAHGLCLTGWHAMEAYQAFAVAVATRTTEAPMPPFPAWKQHGTKQSAGTMGNSLQTQTTKVVGLAHETLSLVMEYLAMLVPMLEYAELHYQSSPWGTEGHRTAGDAEMEAVQDLLGQIETLKKENFALKHQIKAATLAAAARAAAEDGKQGPPKKESARNSSLAKSRPGLCPRCCDAMAQPEMQAKSPVWSSVSSELQSAPRSRSVGSIPLVSTAATDCIVSVGESIADLVDENLLAGKERERNCSDTFSEGQAELLQKPLPARLKTPPFKRGRVSDWVAQANTTGSWEGNTSTRARSPPEEVCALCGGASNNSSSGSNKNGGAYFPGLVAKYRNLVRENRLLDADYQQLEEEYDAQAAAHKKKMYEYDQLKDMFDDLSEEFELLRKRYDYERSVHNRVTAMYVTKTSDVKWNGEKRSPAESPSVSPKTAAEPFRKSIERPFSPATTSAAATATASDYHLGESNDNIINSPLTSQGQSLHAFLSEQWLCWIALYNLVWSTILPGAHLDPILIRQGSQMSETQGAAQWSENRPCRQTRQHGSSALLNSVSNGGNGNGNGISWRALLTMLTHLVLLAALLSWYSCQLEKDIWLQANGLTRNQLIAHTRGEPIWLSNLGLGGGWITGQEVKTLVLWMGLNSRRVMALVSACARRMMM